MKKIIQNYYYLVILSLLYTNIDRGIIIYFKHCKYKKFNKQYIYKV